jgi:hypothetical protein
MQHDVHGSEDGITGSENGITDLFAGRIVAADAIASPRG